MMMMNKKKLWNNSKEWEKTHHKNDDDWTELKHKKATARV